MCTNIIAHSQLPIRHILSFLHGFFLLLLVCDDLTLTSGLALFGSAFWCPEGVAGSVQITGITWMLKLTASLEECAFLICTVLFYLRSSSSSRCITSYTSPFRSWCYPVALTWNEKENQRTCASCHNCTVLTKTPLWGLVCSQWCTVTFTTCSLSCNDSDMTWHVTHMLRSDWPGLRGLWRFVWLTGSLYSEASCSPPRFAGAALSLKKFNFV